MAIIKTDTRYKVDVKLGENTYSFNVFAGSPQEAKEKLIAELEQCLDEVKATPFA